VVELGKAPDPIRYPQVMNYDMIFRIEEQAIQNVRGLLLANDAAPVRQHFLFDPI